MQNSWSEDKLVMKMLEKPQPWAAASTVPGDHRNGGVCLGMMLIGLGMSGPPASRLRLLICFGTPAVAGFGGWGLARS